MVRAAASNALWLSRIANVSVELPTKAANADEGGVVSVIVASAKRISGNSVRIRTAP